MKTEFNLKGNTEYKSAYLLALFKKNKKQTKPVAKLIALSSKQKCLV